MLSYTTIKTECDKVLSLAEKYSGTDEVVLEFKLRLKSYLIKLEVSLDDIESNAYRDTIPRLISAYIGLVDALSRYDDKMKNISEIRRENSTKDLGDIFLLMIGDDTDEEV